MQSFTIPDSENEITQNDIATGKLRITVAYKQYLPNSDTRLDIVTSSGEYPNRNFTKGDGRSDVLTVGKEFMTQMKMKAGDKLRITILKRDHKYLIDKV